MKKWILLSALLGAMPLSMLAQDDDMYFVPTKANVAKTKASYGVPRDTYYSGSNRSADEYNRRGSSYQVIAGDSLSDVIDFSAVAGVYPDSTEEFGLTRQMQRWDGYEPSDAYAAGYTAGRRDSWGWHSPWYWSSYYPWYDYWYYDPWYYSYYGWYGGWYDPWYYGWGYPYYYRSWYYNPGYWGWGGGGSGYAHNYPGTRNHGQTAGSAVRGFGNGRSTTYSGGTFGGSRMGNFGGSRSSASSGTASSRSTGTRTRTSGSSVTANSYGNFGGSSSGSYSGAASRSTSSGGSYSSGGGGGSYGGSRSSGGGGGSRSGGGSFGGGRR